MRVWEGCGEERSQLGPEDKQEFNGPENTGKGVFREEIISGRGDPIPRYSMTRVIQPTGVRLQKWARRSTGKSSLKGQLRSLA